MQWMEQGIELFTFRHSYTAIYQFQYKQSSRLLQQRVGETKGDRIESDAINPASDRTRHCKTTLRDRIETARPGPVLPGHQHSDEIDPDPWSVETGTTLGTLANRRATHDTFACLRNSL